MNVDEIHHISKPDPINQIPQSAAYQHTQDERHVSGPLNRLPSHDHNTEAEEQRNQRKQIRVMAKQAPCHSVIGGAKQVYDGWQNRNCHSIRQGMGDPCLAGLVADNNHHHNQCEP
jgi:hypothetical protein